MGENELAQAVTELGTTLTILIVLASMNVALGFFKLGMMCVLLVFMCNNRRRFDKHLSYVEKKTDEYLTIMKRVGALVTGRMGQAQKDLERTGDRIQHAIVETSQKVHKDVIDTVATSERFPKMDTDQPAAPETTKINKGDERDERTQSNG